MTQKKLLKEPPNQISSTIPKVFLSESSLKKAQKIIQNENPDLLTKNPDFSPQKEAIKEDENLAKAEGFVQRIIISQKPFIIKPIFFY
jgi:hypothetical protein